MSRPCRLAPVFYLGHSRYFSTACAHQRQFLFRDAATVTMVTGHFLRAAETEGCEVLAYCFMPDHVHLLVAGTSHQADFLRFMKLAKQRSGWQYARERAQRLWQAGYHEKVLRHEEDTVDAIRYIVSNPLRAGLVASVGDYPFWGSQKYSRAEILSFVSEGRRT